MILFNNEVNCSNLHQLYHNMVWTFQSFYNTCGLQLKEDDIFDKTSLLIKSLRNGEEVDETDFGPIMSPGVNSSKAVYDVKK